MLTYRPETPPDKRIGGFATRSYRCSHAIVDVRGAPDVVAIGIALASQDVDESGCETAHVRGHGIVRAKVDALEMRILLDRAEGTRKALVRSVGR